MSSPREINPTIERPRDIRAGFAAAIDDLSGSGLLQAGEQWAPARFMIDEHAHPVWEWYLQLHGVTRWFADRRLWTIRPGDLFGVAPQTPHAMAEAPGSNVHFYYASFDPEAVIRRQPTLSEVWPHLDRVVHLPDAPGLIDAFSHLIHELTSRPSHLDIGLQLAADRLVLEITRRLQRGTVNAPPGLHPAVHETQATLDREYARTWSLQALGQRVNLAPSYLAGLFSAQVGRGPHQYQTDRRIARAKQLLRTSDLSITAIAIDVGFGSGQHLARTFRQLTGSTPSDYRRHHRTGA